MQPTMATAVFCIVALVGCASVENVDVTKAETVCVREMHDRLLVLHFGSVHRHPDCRPRDLSATGDHGATLTRPFGGHG